MRCDWQEPFVSHMVSVDGPNSQKNHSPQLVVCNLPGLRQPPLCGWPRPCYSCRCLSSTRIGLAAVEHPCRPLSDLFDDLFRSFLYFLCASTCYISVTIQVYYRGRKY